MDGSAAPRTAARQAAAIPLGQDLQGARKLYVGREDRPSNPLSTPTLTAGGPPVRIAYEVQPDERHPERILILAVGAKPDIYDDAAARR